MSLLNTNEPNGKEPAPINLELGPEPFADWLLRTIVRRLVNPFAQGAFFAGLLIGFQLIPFIMPPGTNFLLGAITVFLVLLLSTVIYTVHESFLDYHSPKFRSVVQELLWMVPGSGVVGLIFLLIPFITIGTPLEFWLWVRASAMVFSIGVFTHMMQGFGYSWYRSNPKLHDYPFFNRLRYKTFVDLYHLKAQDNGLRVYTNRGVDVVNIKLPDALIGLMGYPGVQTDTHNWVAISAVERMEADKNQLKLVLINGNRVPVSSKYRFDVNKVARAHQWQTEKSAQAL